MRSRAGAWCAGGSFGRQHMTEMFLSLTLSVVFAAASISWTRSVLRAITLKSVYWKMTEFKQAERPVMFVVATVVNGVFALIFLANAIYFALALFGVVPVWPTPRTHP